MFTGLLLQGVAAVGITNVEHPSTIGLTLAIAALIGAITLLAGAIVYAKAKGRHPAWGLLALFSLFGLTLLFLLPDLD